LNNLKVEEQGKPLQLVNLWLGYSTRFCAYISAVMIILMALITTYSVIRRYLFHDADNNAFLAICVITLFFASFSWAEIQRQKRHIVVDYFSDRFSQNVKEIILDAISPLFGLVFCVILLWKNVAGALFSLDIGEVTLTSIALPVFPLKVAIIIGVTLLCLVLFSQLVNYLALLWTRLAGKKQQQP
jgi:TRAP-type mannitol/chloroaromatic compound transport system permease small subunit